MFEEAGEEEGDHVYFKRTLTAFELQQVAPYLKDAKHLESTALVYNVPKEWFDASKFKEPLVDTTVMGSAGHHPEQNDINKEKRNFAPPPKATDTV